MHQFSDPNHITIYQIPGRYVTVIIGNSGIAYPFYQSTGINSDCSGTWFPWMGYFKQHPLSAENPAFLNQIYMVKPEKIGLSDALVDLIYKHLGQKAENFIYRMGNDEALAISCCLGHGEWEKYPELREAILTDKTTKKYLKTFEIEDMDMQVSIPKTRKQILFNGLHCKVQIDASQAIVAQLMEKITSTQASKYLYLFSIQQKDEFPATKELQTKRLLFFSQQTRVSFINQEEKTKEINRNTLKP